MSWSMMEPEELPECECKYDEARDQMDREDCPFHCNLTGDVPAEEQCPIQRKQPAPLAVDPQEGAA